MCILIRLISVTLLDTYLQFCHQCVLTIEIEILHHENSVKDYEATNLSTVKNSRKFKIHMHLMF